MVSVSPNGDSSSVFIPDDGYTESGFIRARAGLHGALRFRYRPMLVEDRSRILGEFEHLRPEAAELKAAGEIHRRLVWWDLCDGQSKPVPISLDVVRRLKPAVFARVWAIVLGTEPSDIDPGWSAEEKLAAAELQATAGPGPVGDAREVRDEKNSATG
jgi:hypothetical protein